MDEDLFLNKFVENHIDDLRNELKERKQKLTDKIIGTEEFTNWFNEEFVADRWIDFVSMTVDNMNQGEITTMLVEYGLDNAFELCKTIGIFEDVDNIRTSKILWHIIDHWYCYHFVVNRFKNKLNSKK